MEKDYMRCVNCGNYLKDSPDSRTMYCPKCFTRYDREKIDALINEQLDKEEKIRNEMPHWERTFLQNDWRAHEDKVRAYNCPSCGAKLICDENTAATSCPYCGNHAIIEDRLTGAFKPDYVLPFKLGREDAVKCLKEYFNDWRLTPEGYADEECLKTIKGVYVPFWIFESKAEAKQYYYCRKFCHGQQGTSVNSRNEYYHAYRTGMMEFEKIVVDASEKMPDLYMGCVAPYDLTGMEPFSGLYLSGYYTEKCNINISDMVWEIEENYKKLICAEMRKTVSEYDAAELKDQHITIGQGNIYYAMLPVWLLNIKWKGKNYLYAVNGQTGKTAGMVPASPKKTAVLFAKTALPFMAIGGLLTILLRGLSDGVLLWGSLISLGISLFAGYWVCSNESIRMDLRNFCGFNTEAKALKGLQLTEKVDDYDRCIESNGPK